MTRAAVGIHVHAEPHRLLATLAALRRHPRSDIEILLLADGPDEPTRAAMRHVGLPMSETRDPLGEPACFNRLAARSDAGVVVFLESGAVPAPGALDRLVDAVLADERTGLAGPSTNDAWTVQCAFPGRDGHPEAVVRTGNEAVRRFGDDVRGVGPLFGLSDFCFAVRRQVIEAIGGADEEYGEGPCWEMEYAARAVRAGFRAVWVCGAYVHRAPFTARRRREEARRFDASKRRYQDSLCGLRLRGERPGYEPHCRGDECEHFAPPDLIQLRRPLAATPVAGGRARPVSLPLVSCVMPTRNRAELALHAVRLFERQDYAHLELIVVDDGNDGLEARLPRDERIRYVRAPAGESIGEKRNRACEMARGAFVAQWDDDDWYGSQRLSVQLEPLLAGRADITGLTTPVFFELDSWRAWATTPALHRKLFREDIHGGTLVFAKRVWEGLARYPDASLAEDAAFLLRAKRRGARLERLDGTDHFVYVRHGGNAWQFECGRHLDPRGWSTVPEPALPGEDRAFYAALARGASPSEMQVQVSCIMPTADRRPFVTHAIEYFLRQEHRASELVVVDDGDDDVADLMPPDSRIRYLRLDGRMVLGDKRNHACELARGDVILHWDDDDWHAPWRIGYQLAELERRGAPLCGLSRVLHFEPSSFRAWVYEYPQARHRWVAGGTLCYERELWARSPFPSVQVGEDTRFLWRPGAARCHVHEDHTFFAAVVHAGNTSPKTTAGSFWHPHPVAEVQALLGDDWTKYAVGDAA